MMYQNKARTIIEMRQGRWDHIAGYRKQLTIDEGEDLVEGNISGVVYRVKVPKGLDLEDTDIMLLVGGRDNLSGFKSITREGDEFIVFIAEDILIPDSTGGGNPRIFKGKGKK